MKRASTVKGNVPIQTKVVHDTFVEEFFGSDIYKEIIARNDTKGTYVVRTVSNSVYLLDRDSNSCIELHFPEEILTAIKECQ